MATTGFSIAGIVRRWGTETPAAPAFVCGTLHQTWGQTYDMAKQVAGALVAAGVGSQDRVAFLDKNGIEYFDVLLGGALLNAVNVAVNWRLAPAEMSFIINDAEATVLFVHADFLDHLAQMRADLMTVKHVVVIGAETTSVGTGWAEWLASATPSDPGEVAADGDVAMQLYTSGTTGLPKGVMLSNWNLSGLVEGAGELDITDPTIVNSLVAMPLFHIGGSGWALLGLTIGARSTIVREIDPAVVQALLASGVTHAFLVPAVLSFCLIAPADGLDFSSLKAIAYGASPISEDVLTRCMDRYGCDFFQLYGLTETTGGICMLRPEDHTDETHRERLRSAGRPMPGVELRIVDTLTGATIVADDVVGEVWIKAPQNMLGYWHRDEENAKTLVEGGEWLRSGDAGFLKDGYLYLHDRVKDMIVTGGENVYPAEVENAMMSHPDVADVAVIGVPSERWGEEVKAIVVAAPGTEPTTGDLISWARDRLAGYKCPKSVDFIEALPRNPSGKILKKDLRAPFWVGRARQIG